MTRGFLVIIVVLALLSACTHRMICPAYQSSFIYDKEALRQKFSYFKEDSTPKILTASKDKYLIAVPESYRKTYRKMQTIEMKPIYPQKPDSLKKKADDDMLLAELDSAQVDSATQKLKTEPGDSAYAITKTKEKYNLDQDLYMWYFREMLVLPDVRAAIENKDRKPSEAAAGKKEKVGFLQGIKNIFKKKPKADSTAVKDASGKPIPEPPKKKSGLFKKKKKKSPDPSKEKDPAKKEGDGF
jgi:hypothetical protein